MPDLFGFDAFAPREIAARVEAIGVAKARLPLLSTLMLAVLAGAFIGLGALNFVLVRSDPMLGFAARQLAGGVAFSLGLILVVVAGAELFTGNNLLVCMAVWMATAGRSVVDKVVAIVFPISAFVAAGFEHSVANFYLIPLGMLLQSVDGVGPALPAITWAGFAHNAAPVVLGNLVGGAVLVGLVYHVIYQRSSRTPAESGGVLANGDQASGVQASAAKPVRTEAT